MANYVSCIDKDKLLDSREAIDDFLDYHKGGNTSQKTTGGIDLMKAALYDLNSGHDACYSDVLKKLNNFHENTELTDDFNKLQECIKKVVLCFEYAESQGYTSDTGFSTLLGDLSSKFAIIYGDPVWDIDGMYNGIDPKFRNIATDMDKFKENMFDTVVQKIEESTNSKATCSARTNLSGGIIKDFFPSLALYNGFVFSDFRTGKLKENAKKDLSSNNTSNVSNNSGNTTNTNNVNNSNNNNNNNSSVSGAKQTYSYVTVNDNIDFDSSEPPKITLRQESSTVDEKPVVNEVETEKDVVSKVEDEVVKTEQDKVQKPESDTIVESEPVVDETPKEDVITDKEPDTSVLEQPTEQIPEVNNQQPQQQPVTQPQQPANVQVPTDNRNNTITYNPEASTDVGDSSSIDAESSTSTDVGSSTEEVVTDNTTSDNVIEDADSSKTITKIEIPKDSSKIESSSKGGSVIPIALGVAAAGAAATVGAKYIKSRNNADSSNTEEDNYYLEDDSTFDDSEAGTEKYQAGNLNGLSINGTDDLIIEDDYSDDFEEELE